MRPKYKLSDASISAARQKELESICEQFIEMNAGDDPACKSKVDAISDCLNRATADDPTLRPYLLDFITIPEVTYTILENKGMPCGHTMFYRVRRDFFQMLHEALKLRTN
jgi:hypothetical protein